MTKVVYQQGGLLHSCIESQLMETRTLRLKLASPKKPPFLQFPDSIDAPNLNSPKPELGCWNLFQSLSPKSPNPKLDNCTTPIPTTTPYVPPLMKQRPSSSLSDKSLELCTENLGSETGSETSSDCSILSLSSSSSSLDLERGRGPRTEQPAKSGKISSFSRRVSNSQNFPPPLTSRSSLQVRSHRENGRLVIEAIEAPSARTCLQAERSNGRLRLSYLVERSSEEFESEEESEEEKGFENEAKEEEEEEEEVVGGGDDDVHVHFDVKEEEEGEKVQGGEERGECENRGINDNIFGVGVKMGIEKFQRPSRCKEGGCGKEGLCNWEPFWVATS